MSILQIALNSSQKDLIEIAMPKSKSLSNRALIMQYLAHDRIQIDELSEADDTVILKRILSDFDGIINVGDAGTVFRFLTALACIIPGKRIITGSFRITERPIRPLVEALKSIGADIQYAQHDGFAPLLIHGNKGLIGGMIDIDASISSQFISALMLISPYLEKGLILNLMHQPVSFSFIELTARMMQNVGIQVRIIDNQITIPSAEYQHGSILIEGDYASASYWFSFIRLLPYYCKVKFTNLRLHSIQPDSKVVQIFENLGIKAEESDNSLLIYRERDYHVEGKLILDFIDCPDIAMTVAVCIAALDIEAELTGLQTLEFKESKRLTALQTELSKFGKKIEIVNGNALRISGNFKWNDTIVRCYGDHRMAMSFSSLVALGKPLTLDDKNVVSKSYPQFWESMKNFIEIINET